MRYGLVVFFAALAFIGLGHGFPLIDLFKDEVLYSTLVSMERHTILPIDLPYGTVSFYGTYVLQPIVLFPAFVSSGFDVQALRELVMDEPYLAYIAPRVLNAVLFVVVAFLTVRHLEIGKPSQPRYAHWIVLIVMSNAVLLTFAHSGKQWPASMFLFFLSGLYLSTSARKAIVFASLALANFLLMTLFWAVALVQSLYAKRGNRREDRILLLLSVAAPIVMYALNPEAVHRVYIALSKPFDFMEKSALDLPRQTPPLDTARILELATLYALTLGAYLKKIASTAPLTLLVLALAVVGRAKVRDRTMFRFGLASTVLYWLFIGSIFFSRFPYEYYRYLLPFQISLALMCLSLELPRTRMNDVLIPAAALAAAYVGVVTTVNLALPTTYNAASEQLVLHHSDANALIVSEVSEISFPYTRRAAELAMIYAPRICAARCQFALANDSRSGFQGNYLKVREPTLVGRLIAGEPGMDLVRVRYDAEDVDYVECERALGDYFIPLAWWPSRLGRRVSIRPTVVKDRS